MNAPANGSEIVPQVTTIGRKSGKPRTVEIRVYYWNGRLIATSPYPSKKRDWVQNVMANPDVVIRSGDKVTKARAKIVKEDPSTTDRIAMHRISWRTDHCPVFQPSTDTFVEFFPEIVPEELYNASVIRHKPEKDPLAAASLEGVLEWQKKGNYYET
ncbi:MAG: nitroreductase family deazaflavin-dependent oxidoreductase [Deltaproteobacteria bacterium]|nr:nitroreductase family deazaflavin-dependent oxidoreductase [Deltaproteobacteria bacterium]